MADGSSQGATTAASISSQDGRTQTDVAGPQSEKHYTREAVLEATRAVQHDSAPRGFGLWSIIGLAYTVLNSWTAMSTSLSVALPSGGPTAVLWGIPVAGVCNLAMAASLAEMAHVYTTSGGPYHWAFVLAAPEWAPLVAYITGWVATAGYWALMATTGSLAGSLLTGAYALNNPSYEPQRYQVYIVYIGYTLISTFLNIYTIRLLPYLNKAAIIWSLSGAVMIVITCLACASGDYQSGDFVFREFINETGWPNGLAWLLGLLQASFGLTGYDAVSHMVEEMPSPHINAPIAMVASVIIGSVSSFIFLVCLLFSISDVNEVISSSAGALLASMYQATGSVAGATCLQVFPLVAMFFTSQGILTAASRMTAAFARDGGLPFSPFFARVNPKTGVPDNAVLLTSTLVIIFGVLYIPSASALNAILSSSVILLNVSYSVPVAILLFRGRHLLEPPSFPAPTMLMRPWLGRTCNVVGLAFTIFTTVLFCFPPELPVTASNMNYAVAVFGIIFLVAACTWITARKHYVGPRDIGALLELARAEVAEPHRRDLEHSHSKKQKVVQ